MSSDISVSKYGANTLAAAQKNMQQLRLNTISNKINTGLQKVSGPDTAAFSGKGGTSTASQLSQVKDSLDNGASTLQAASNGLSKVGDLLDQAKKLAESSRGASVEDRAANAKQFNNILKQIDKVSQNSDYNGKNLLQGDNLTVQTGTDKTSAQTVKGSNVSSSDLGVSAAQNNFASDADVEKALAQLNGDSGKKGATGQVQDLQSATNQKLGDLQNRSSFTKGMISALSSAPQISFTDLNDESASLLAMQTRQQLGSLSLGLANQSQQTLMSLFG